MPVLHGANALDSKILSPTGCQYFESLEESKVTAVTQMITPCPKHENCEPPFKSYFS